ncbi:MAG TPA: hypothetical protein VKF36_23370, partial [Syntrophorhabdales bacterium]|nr:hypothetical protein [Syntrophorhabdales bacterium]
MQDRRKGAAEGTPTKQDGKKPSARNAPSAKKASVNRSAEVTDERSHRIVSAYHAMSTKKRLLIISLLLIIAAFTAFWQVTHGDFVT